MLKDITFDYDVFISYSSRDNKWVWCELLPAIERHGIRACIDFRDFIPGKPSITEIERCITASRKTLMILTPSYIESEWCEIESIMLQTISPANRNLRLIPLLKTECEKPLRVAALTHIDFTDHADPNLSWKKLLSSLETLPEPRDQTMPTAVKEELDQAKALTDAGKYTEAIPVLERALQLADATENYLGRVKSRQHLAIALYEAREDFTGAEQLFRDALALVPVDKNDLKQNLLHGLGEMLLFSGRLDESKAVLHAAHEVTKLTRNIEELAGSLNSLGLLEQQLGFHDSANTKFDEAIEQLLKSSFALKDGDKRQHAHILAVCYINKALLCRESGNHLDALSYFGKAEKHHLASDEKLDAGKCLLLRGEIHCADANWEEGFKCFDRALKLFLEAGNSMWGARALENLSRLFASQERWEEAMRAMEGAVLGAAEAGHPKEQIHFLRLAAQLLREWKAREARQNFLRAAMKSGKNLKDDEQKKLLSLVSEQLDELSKLIESAMRNDEQIGNLLREAKDIAQRENLCESLADCLLDEAHDLMEPNDTEGQKRLTDEAIKLLSVALMEIQPPKQRGRLMGRISALHLRLGHTAEAMAWLQRAGEIFKTHGDVFGLANYYGSLAELHRAENDLDNEISSYRRAISTIDGRSFNRLATGFRINLAAALCKENSIVEAQRLLDEAEKLCDRYEYKDFKSAIAHNRNSIDTAQHASQIPTHTLKEILVSLGELLRYRPEDAHGYLLFWYFAWKTKLMSLIRSGPLLSFMVVTDDVDRFLSLARKFTHLADHFLLTTSRDFTVKIPPITLAIPPTWMIPPNFKFLGVRRVGPEADTDVGKDDALPNFNLTGPATLLPMFNFVQVNSAVKGEGHVMSMSSTYLPQEAIDLLVGHPIEELTDLRVLWFPIDRVSSKDTFLTELRIGRERGVFPIYIGHIPTSEHAINCGGVRVPLPQGALSGRAPALGEKWRRALFKLAILPKEKAQRALLDLPETFGDVNEIDVTVIEVHLFEFTEIGKRKGIYPVILVRD